MSKYVACMKGILTEHQLIRGGYEFSIIKNLCLFFARKKKIVNRRKIHRRWAEVWIHIWFSFNSKRKFCLKKSLFFVLCFVARHVLSISIQRLWMIRHEWKGKKFLRLNVVERGGGRKYDESVNLYSNIFLSQIHII